MGLLKFKVIYRLHNLDEKETCRIPFYSSANKSFIQALALAADLPELWVDRPEFSRKTTELG